MKKRISVVYIEKQNGKTDDEYLDLVDGQNRLLEDMQKRTLLGCGCWGAG